ncbi:MAG: hypothetical protein QW270_08865 [Candidatus Bathyarchaeia archaeon]
MEKENTRVRIPPRPPLTASFSNVVTEIFPSTTFKPLKCNRSIQSKAVNQ